MRALVATSVATTARRRALRSALALPLAALAMVGLAACANSTPATGTTAPAAATASASAVAPDTKPGLKPGTLAGTRYYFGTTSKDAVIHAVRADSDEVVARVPLGAGECVRNTVTVSPDGKRLAWVQDGDADGMNGTLMTASVDGSGKRKLLTGVVCLGSRPLSWQGGDHLMVGTASRSLLVDVTTGKSAEPAVKATSWVWSADGRYVARVENRTQYVVGPGVRRSFHYEPPKAEATMHDGWQARSVSLDGRYVSIGWVGTDPSRVDGSFTVVDTTSSKVVKLPTSGEIKSIQFAADGTVLVRQATRILVLDARFRQVGEVAEAGDVRDLTLLTYVS